MTPRSLDAIAAIGERLSSLLVVAVMCARIPAQLVDAGDVMITDDHFTRAEPQTELIADAAQHHPSAVGIGHDAGRGRVRRRDDGWHHHHIGTRRKRLQRRTFRRALRADAIEIWTDVDGMLTADPRVVDGARLIEQIRFDEASSWPRSAPRCFTPAPSRRRSSSIPVYIYNSVAPRGAELDHVRRTAPPGERDRGQARCRAHSHPNAPHAARARVPPADLRDLRRNRTSVDVVATSEVSVSMTIDDATHLDGLLGALTSLGDVSAERNRGIVALVGAGLGDSTATMAQALSAWERSRCIWSRSARVG
jgi:aspartate kinase